VEPGERLTALWREHHAAVLRYASRRTDAEAAQDVVSDTFLVAWRRLPEVPDDPAQARPWLYAVARRVLANSDRSRRRTQRLSTQLSRAGVDAEGVPDPAEGVTERALVRQALGLLAERDAEALRLVCWEDLDLAGAALAMGCSRTAMAVRLHRARRRMATALRLADGGEGESPGEPVAGHGAHKSSAGRVAGHEWS
jgi:RNA polymerase sigma-70 factor (ECF subfamily)